MAHATLERKLVVWILVLFLVPTLVAGAILVILYRSEVFRNLSALILTVIIGFAAMMGYLGIVAHAIGRTLVRTLLEIQRGTELMATVNPAHRHRIDTGNELQSVAEEINRLADQVRDARAGLESQVARATATLEGERAALAHILEELDDGVVVATLERRITLANRAARRLLQSEALLGQSVFGLVDRETVARSLYRLRAGHGAPEEFMLRPPRRLVRAGMTSLGCNGGEMTGFILVLRDVSHPARGNVDDPTAPFRPDEEAPRSRCFVGAGMVSGSGARLSIHGHADLYDFSVFERTERHVLPSDRACRLDGLTLVSLDTETTGLRPEDDHEIVSLAGVKILGGTVRRRQVFDALVNPGRAVPAESSSLHGITDQMVAGAPPIDVVLPAFERFVRGAALVGHEIWFDLRFLSRAADRIGLPVPSVAHPILDVVLLSQAVHPEESLHSLEAIAARLGVVIQGRHSALGDALAAAEIFVRLLPLLERRGIVTLGQALDAARAVRGRWTRPRGPA